MYSNKGLTGLQNIGNTVRFGFPIYILYSITSFYGNVVISYSTTPLPPPQLYQPLPTTPPYWPPLHHHHFTSPHQQCFMNCVLQCLSNTRPFLELTLDPPADFLRENKSRLRGSLISGWFVEVLGGVLMCSFWWGFGG